MNPHPRIRKTLKCGLTILTGMLAVSWIGSGWWFVSISNSTGWTLALECGRLNVVIPDADSHLATIPGFFAGARHFQLWWWFEADHPGYGFYCIPLWAILCVAAGATRLAWWFDGLAQRCDRIAAIRCPNCNYDRTGLAPSAVCPECGSNPS